MTNEQINRGMKYLHILDSGLENPKMYVKDMMKVLEAMKEPEEEEDDIYISEHGTVYRKDIDYVEGYKKWEANKGGEPSKDIKI